MPQLAVAVLGPDRPGVVAALTEALLADEGNLEDASMTLLRGQFAMTLVVDVASSAEQVRADLAPLAERLDLAVSVCEAAPVVEAVRPPADPWLLRVHGADRPGLVHRLTALLASYEANITDLSTRLVGGPDRPVYVVLVAVDVPTAAPVEVLRRAVAQLAADLDVEATLQPADGDVL